MDSLVVQDKIWLPHQLGIHVDDVYSVVIVRLPRQERVIPFLKQQENKRLIRFSCLIYKFYPDLYGLKNIFGSNMSDDLFKIIWMMNYCMFTVTSFDRNNWSRSFSTYLLAEEWRRLEREAEMKPCQSHSVFPFHKARKVHISKFLVLQSRYFLWQNASSNWKKVFTKINLFLDSLFIFYSMY